MFTQTTIPLFLKKINEIRINTSSLADKFCNHPRFKYKRKKSFDSWAGAIVAYTYSEITSDEKFPFHIEFHKERAIELVEKRFKYSLTINSFFKGSTIRFIDKIEFKIKSNISQSQINFSISNHHS